MTERQRLETFDVMLWMHSWNFFTAFATKHFINTQFYGRGEAERRTLYARNPANTICYRSNSTMMESSIVAIAEYLKQEDRREPIDLAGDDRRELRKHRIVLSHPANVEFTETEVQNFYAAGMHNKDPVAERIWRVRAAVIDRLVQLGSSNIRPIEVVAQLGTFEIIEGALNNSLERGATPFSRAETQESVPRYFKQVETALRQRCETVPTSKSPSA